jgi:tetratricopeptide (TPR) repeat protein
MGLFTSLFGGKKDSENEKEKNDKKNFDILKYDGIRAMRIGKLTYAIKCLEEATAIQDEMETLQHLANCYARVNQLNDARTCLNKWLRSPRTNLPYSIRWPTFATFRKIMPA